jgi:MHS family alpha-ketoglutarate permease-like MFS transporter
VPILSTLQDVRTTTQAFWLILAALAIVSFYTAINAVVKAELFPVEVRALGVGLPYALTVAVFGGTAEYVALWFKDAGSRERLLLVRHRLHRRVVAGLPVDARDAAHFAH